MGRVAMPQLGESVTEGTVLKWLKQPGDPVALDDPLCEIETEKVTAELPSPLEGTMGPILVAEGAVAQVGEDLCEVIEAEDQQVAAGRVTAGKWEGGPMAIPREEARSSRAPGPAAEAQGRGQARPERRERFYSPVVIRLAGEHGIDLEQLEGTGIGGRVTRRDVERHLETRPATASAPHVPQEARAAGRAAFTVVPLSPTRRTIAEHLTRANAEIPQAWTMVEADVSRLVARRAEERERVRQAEGVDLTLLHYFAHAVARTLGEHPELNARWENGELRRYHDLNMGVAVATDHGLVVPVIRGAQDLSVIGLARRISDLAERARNRQLRLDDVGQGTITVNNTGAFGSIASRPIVNQPEVAIVTLERVVDRPVVVGGGAIAVRAMVNICLTFDHRAMDGLEAGRFLAALRGRLEAP